MVDSNISELADLDLAKFPLELMALYRRIGHGFEAMINEHNKLTLSIEAVSCASNEWLLVRLTILAENVRLYCKASEWLDFVRPLLAVDEFAHIPSDLHAALTQACLSDFTGWAKQHGISIDNIEAITKAPWSDRRHSEVSLTTSSVFNPDSRLCFYLLGCSSQTIETLTQSMSPVETVPRLETLPIACAVGFSIITMAQLKQLRIGDVVVLNWSCNIDNGELLLFQNRPICGIKFVDSGGFIVEQMMNDFDDLMDLSTKDEFPGLTAQQSPVNLDQITVPIIMEVGQIEVSFHDLANLQSGSILETQLVANPQVRLRANGKVIGFGTLMQVGERLGVRVEQMAE
ncbi:type III secretion system cytoplasmic ring protein SctQ [Vibrio sp. S4M6]|uniref:type III secretion system cytoplasmic ring protein SctQ n=1 Tax=Vibrio sinus TaxID=2946865 RepID=UPI002029FA89|nr:type III secretion system cytoplasmic ring protein SctQ [Vibrio sinus]MCL9783738.1 type III secretion system cytoplasmic ring protein SctQ [Vibrio sinus]